MNKQLEELKAMLPAAYTADDGSVFGPNDFAGGVDEMHHSAAFEKMTPLYSQEYVNALQQRIVELEQAIRHIHGAALDITVPRTAIAKAAGLSVEHAAGFKVEGDA